MKNQYLGDRNDDFDQIPPNSLQSAVILVDPDNGLEVKSSRHGNLHKYIRYSEAKGLFSRMNRDSLLVLYQHLPRVRRERYLADLHNRTQKELGCPTPVSIADSQIALVIVARDAIRRRRIEPAASEYLRRDLLVRDL